MMLGKPIAVEAETITNDARIDDLFGGPPHLLSTETTRRGCRVTSTSVIHFDTTKEEDSATHTIHCRTPRAEISCLSAHPRESPEFAPVKPRPPHPQVPPGE